MSERREHAERYRSMNMEPVPIPAGKKGPCIKGWQRGGHAGAAFNGEGNIGLLTGQVGYGLVCVDLDCTEAIELAPKYLPGTPAVVGRDGRTGCHYFYRCEQPGTKKAWKDPATGDVVAEVLADGQQVVVGPSTHPDGGDYDVLTAEPATVERMEIDEAVGRLHDAVLHTRGHAQREAVTEQQPSDVLTPTGTRPGDDYNDRGLDHFRSVLDRHGWTYTHTSEDGNEHWERPGKDEQSTSATLKDGVFYVFSSSVSGLEPDKGRSMFSVYATLLHGGDHSAAARDLAEQGYGKPKPTPNSSESKPFPIDMLSPTWQRWCSESANAKNIPPEMLAAPAISAAASAIGNAATASPWDGWIEPCIVWTMVVAPSGSMKTTPHFEAITGVHDRQQILNEQAKVQTDDYLEAASRHKIEFKAWEKADGAGAMPPEPHKPVWLRCVLTDTTTEAIVACAAESPRGVLIAAEELSGWFERQGAYKAGKGAGGDDAVWNAGFNGKPYDSARKTTGNASVERFTISITGSIPPDMLKLCGTTRNRVSGLLVRFLPTVVHPPPCLWTGKRLSDDTMGEWRRSFSKLYTFSGYADGSPENLTFTDEAKEWFIVWQDGYANATFDAQGSDELYAAALSKLRGYGVRIALVLALTDWADRPSGMDNPQPTTIGVECVRRACRIVDWFHDQWIQTLHVFKDNADLADDDAVWGWVMTRSESPGETTVREMTHRGPPCMRSNSKASTAWLDSQVAAGRMTKQFPKPAQIGGRPKVVYRVTAADAPVSGGIGYGADMGDTDADQ